MAVSMLSQSRGNVVTENQYAQAQVVNNRGYSKSASNLVKKLNNIAIPIFAHYMLSNVPVANASLEDRLATSEDPIYFLKYVGCLLGTYIFIQVVVSSIKWNGF